MVRHITGPEKEKENSFLRSETKPFIANECPKVSTTEVGLPIAQTIMIIVAGIILQGSSEVVQILAATAITMMILTGVWIKRRHMIVFRMEEGEYKKMRTSNIMPSLMNVRERHDWFSHLSPCNYGIGESIAVPQMETVNMDTDQTDEPLHGYAKACVTASWLVLAAGGIKLNQHQRSGVSAARALAEEWEFELEQVRNPWIQAQHATYMVFSSASFAVRYGVIGRGIERLRQRFNLSKNRCECGELRDDCEGQHSSTDVAPNSYTGVDRREF